VLTDEPIRATQRRAIFAAMHARGLEIDDVRALCPNGSISKLSRAEAGDVLQRLNARTEYEHPRRTRPRSSRRPKGVYRLATSGQRAKIEALRIDLDWTVERLTEWLAGRSYADGRRMNRIDSSNDAAAVIELLKGVVLKAGQARQRRELAASG